MNMHAPYMRKACYDFRRGYITLISVMVVGAIGIALILSQFLLGVSTSRSSFVREQFDGAEVLANMCAEEALQQMRNSTPFTGSGSLSTSNGTCTYTVTSQGGDNRTVMATGNAGSLTRKVKVIIDAIN